MSEQLRREINTKAKENIITKGNEILQVRRIPTGSLSLDVETGGGIPVGRITSLVGPWSSGKTAVALKIAAEFQKRWPEKDIYWIDAEGVFDPKWCRALGLDPTKVELVRPQYAEQAYDIALRAIDENCGLLVIDSLAALSSKAEMEATMEEVQVAAMAKVNTKFLRKMGTRISKDEKDIPPTLIYLNQFRTKVGVSFGNPEYEPGGDALAFYPSLKIILRKGDLYDGNRVYKSVTANDEGVEVKAQVIKFYTEKNKTAPFKRRGHFWFYFDTLDELRRKGVYDRLEEIMRYIKKYGIAVEVAKGRFELVDIDTGEVLKFHGANKMAAYIRENHTMQAQLEMRIMQAVLKDMNDDETIPKEQLPTVFSKGHNEEAREESSKEV